MGPFFGGPDVRKTAFYEEHGHACLNPNWAAGFRVSTCHGGLVWLSGDYMRRLFQHVVGTRDAWVQSYRFLENKPNCAKTPLKRSPFGAAHRRRR